jgi:hypothetical protein
LSSPAARSCHVSRGHGSVSHGRTHATRVPMSTLRQSWRR